MYHFLLLNSKIIKDFSERYVLEPTVQDLQLEVRYVGGREVGDTGVEFGLIWFFWLRWVLVAACGI